MASAVTRALKIQKALAGKSLTGMALKDIATAIDDSTVNCHRSLQDLTAEGFVTQFEHNKNYALSTAMLAIARAYSLEMQQAQGNIDSMQQRVNAHATQLTA